jgi:hypothetical protein
VYDERYTVFAKIDDTGIIQTKVTGAYQDSRIIYDWRTGGGTFKYNDKFSGAVFPSVAGVMGLGVNYGQDAISNECVANWVY